MGGQGESLVNSTVQGRSWNSLPIYDDNISGFQYSKHETKLKHCYEIIPETAVCKLYFDLEFYKPTNQGANANQMVADLIKVIFF